MVPKPLACWICGKQVDLSKCKVDEHGLPVHEPCHVAKMAFNSQPDGQPSSSLPPTSKSGQDTIQERSSAQQIPAGPFRHQCLIYEGAPSRQLPAVAAMMRQMLGAGYRGLYLNSPAMVAGMSSYLAAQGTDVAQEISKTSLILSSDRSHLSGGSFDVEEMIGKLEHAIVRALRDGFKGLWATGDMLWEFGSEKNLQKLVRYERQLEELFRRQPLLCGICQYHGDLLPDEILRQGLLTHRSVFINETLSRINIHYAEA